MLSSEGVHNIFDMLDPLSVLVVSCRFVFCLPAGLSLKAVYEAMHCTLSGVKSPFAPFGKGGWGIFKAI
jgi:hypothetical protein